MLGWLVTGCGRRILVIDVGLLTGWLRGQAEIHAARGNPVGLAVSAVYAGLADRIARGDFEEGKK